MATRSTGMAASDFDTDDNGYPMPDAPEGTSLGRWMHQCPNISKRVHRSQMVLVSGDACDCGATRPPKMEYPHDA